MLQLQYPHGVAARVIAVTPLNFAAQTNEEVQALRKEFSETLVAAILESQKTSGNRKQPQPQPQPTAPTGSTVPAEMVGTWLGKVDTGQLQFVFSGNREYQFNATIGNQQSQDQGTFALTGSDLILTSNQTQKQYSLSIQLTGDLILITDPQFGEVPYVRVR
jgi:hypothetical protein